MTQIRYKAGPEASLKTVWGLFEAILGHVWGEFTVPGARKGPFVARIAPGRGPEGCLECRAMPGVESNLRFHATAKGGRNPNPENATES